MISLTMLFEDLKALCPVGFFCIKTVCVGEAAGGITIFVTWRED